MRLLNNRWYTYIILAFLYTVIHLFSIQCSNNCCTCWDNAWSTHRIDGSISKAARYMLIVHVISKILTWRYKDITWWVSIEAPLYGAWPPTLQGLDDIQLRSHQAHQFQLIMSKHLLSLHELGYNSWILAWLNHGLEPQCLGQRSSNLFSLLSSSKHTATLQ